jgi:2-polyprenyl-6-hydroxyphenyl methylase/3-demethylubiquinone-9 3-methyltransferase
MSLRWRIAQWFELKWWQRYFAAKDKHSYYQWKKEYWRGLIDQIGEGLPLAHARSLADLGCGPAGIFIIFGDKQVTAVDPLLDTYAATLSFFDRADYPYTTFVNQQLEEYAPAEPHDLVFCMNAINHVADIELAYDRLVAAAKPNGYLIVSIDAHNHSFFKRLFRLIPGDILHPHQYDLEEYATFMIQRGCRITQTLLVKKEFFFSHYVLVCQRG